MENFVTDGMLPNELKAHIYQQLAQLEMALPKDSSISITLHDPMAQIPPHPVPATVAVAKVALDSDVPTSKKRKKKTHPTIAVIEVMTPMGQLTGAGTGENLYEAVTFACESMDEQLTSIQLAVDDEYEREQEIDTIMQQRYLH